MRPLHIAAILSLVIGAILYLTVFHRPEADLASLIPEDALFAVVYRSGNDLREFFEGPYARHDLDPFQRRIGERTNVPGLNGVSYIDPVGSYVTAAKEEVFVVPYSDFRAFKDAWDVEREELNLRSPHRPANNYLSLSGSTASARIGKENPLVRRAVEYPVALVGRPVNAIAVRDMLRLLLGFESRRQPDPLVPLLIGTMLRDFPAGAGAFVAEGVETVLVGLKKPEEPPPLAGAEIELRLASGGPLDGAPAFSQRCDLGRLAGSFPLHTRGFVGAVLSEAGWQRTGINLPSFGDGAVGVAIVEPKERHPRPYVLLLAVHPGDESALGALDRDAPAMLAGKGAADLNFQSFLDAGTRVRTAELDVLPDWLATPLRTSTKDKAPPIYLTTASEEGIWYCALGSQAERVVRNALGCLRGAEQLSVRASFQDRAAGVTEPTPIIYQREIFRPNGVLCGWITPRGLHAVRAAMPHIELGAIGQPGQVSFRLDPDGADGLQGRLMVLR